jgi:hypothetical protein
MLRLTPSIHLSLGLPLLRVPSGSHSKILFIYLFICNLFKDDVSSSCYAACDDRSSINNESGTISKEVGVAEFNVGLFSRHLSEGTEDNHDTHHSQ